MTLMDFGIIIRAVITKNGALKSTILLSLVKMLRICFGKIEKIAINQIRIPEFMASPVLKKELADFSSFDPIFCPIIVIVARELPLKIAKTIVSTPKVNV